MTPLTVLGINGSLRGAAGTSAALLDAALARAAAAGHAVRRIDLAAWGAHDDETVEAMIAHVRAADAVLIATGTYWSGPSSVLQRWVEVMTSTEGTDVWRRTSAGVLVTMHGVGGLEVASRLAATLLLWGACLPPAGLLVLDRHQADPDQADPERAAAMVDADTWRLADVEVLVDNVLALAEHCPAFRHWPVEPYPAHTGRWPGVAPG